MEFAVRVENICYTVIYGYLAILTIGGNLLVIAAFFTDKNIRQRVSNYFIVNLAMSDLMCGLVIFTVKFGKKLWSLFQPIDHGDWPLGRTVCGVWVWFGTTLIYTSLFIVISISVDRYLLAKDAMKYTINVTKTKILIAVVVAWILSFSYSIFSTVTKLYLKNSTFEEGSNNERIFPTTNGLGLSSSRGDGTPRTIPPKGSTDLMDRLIPHTSDGIDSHSGVVTTRHSICSEDTYAYVTNYELLVSVDFLLFFGILATINGCVCLKMTRRARNGIFRSNSAHHKYRVEDDGDTPAGHNFSVKSDVSKATTREPNRDRESPRNSDIMISDNAIVKESTNGSHGREPPNGDYGIAMKPFEKTGNDETREPPRSWILQREKECKKRRYEEQRRRKCDRDRQLDGNQQNILIRQNRKAVTSLLVLVVVYVVCWCPYYIVSILEHYKVLNITEFVINLSLDMIWLNSTINPFLYGATNVRFKRGMVSVLRRIVNFNSEKKGMKFDEN